LRRLAAGRRNEPVKTASAVGHLVYDFSPSERAVVTEVSLLDTTLRDGLQAPAMRVPTLEEKSEFFRLAAEVGFHAVDFAFPANGPRHRAEASHLGRYARLRQFPFDLVCLTRATEEDAVATVELSQAMGATIEAIVFVGGSRLRHLVEGWHLSDLERRISETTKFLVGEGVLVTCAVEDATRTRPEELRRLFKAGLDAGATRVVIADTVGCATPWSAEAIVHFVRERVIAGLGPIGIDWHGHNDLGLAVANSLAAAFAGADRIHVTALGVGERAGNTSAEQLIAVLTSLGVQRWNLRKVPEYCAFASRVLGRPIPVDAPVVGETVHTTASGIHASAIAKALRMNRPDLAGIVYSAVDPAPYGRVPDIVVGPMSGRANVLFALGNVCMGGGDDALIERVLEAAKSKRRVLSAKDIQRIVEKAQSASLKGRRRRL